MEYKVIEGGGITSPKGFTAGAVYVGVKSRKSQKPDVAVLYSETEASCAAVFTTNKFCAAPVILDREILKNGKARAIVINSGNANAATGTQGIEDARTVEREAEKLLGVGENEVFVCSTGVIGQKLPVEKVLEGVRQIIPAKLDKANGSDAAYAIMTTDTVRKESAYELELSSGTIRIGAMAKGSGMIHPNMATTLAYVTTDAKCDSADLQKMLHNAIDKSFNMCTVDGDTSTNDTMILLANGASGVEVKTEEDKAALAGLIEHICIDMARRIASDGEGATHLIVVESYGLPTEHDARLVAKAIAGSTLFKAAVFGRDANWGRIMAAAGYSGADVDPTKADCIIKSSAGEVQVMKDGFGTDFSEELAKAVLTEEEREIGVALVDLGGGTTDIAVFANDAIKHTAVLALGGQNLSNDIAFGLRTPIASAEKIKIKYGCALADLVRHDEFIEVPSVGGREPRRLSRQVLAEICEPRMEEILYLVDQTLVRSGYKDMIGAGVVLTGGTALMEGCQELGEQIFNLPTRIGYPRNVGGLKDVVNSPKFSTAVGLLRYGAEKEMSGQKKFTTRSESGVFDGVLSRMKKWFADIS